MRTPLTVAGLTVVVAAAIALPAGAATNAPSINTLAEQECRKERQHDRADFRRDYGGLNATALRRCIADQKREARQDCREERREDSADYRRDYGSGASAFRRCVIDELR